jgi:hypothetical protein
LSLGQHGQQAVSEIAVEPSPTTLYSVVQGLQKADNSILHIWRFSQSVIQRIPPSTEDPNIGGPDGKSRMLILHKR